ncbi:7026_t:CDS:2, partial [Scutellospora calospora]
MLKNLLIRLMNISESLNNYVKESPMSDNPEINKFIQEDGRLKWIPYEKLTNIEYLAHGGFGVVSKAKWGFLDVALKSLNNSKGLTAEILKEITYYQRFDHKMFVIYVTQLYGISQDPVTRNYLMVMPYFEGGSLRQYLNNNYNKLSFNDKLGLLYSMTNGLYSIHDQGLIHKDFHPDIISAPQLLKDLIIKCWDDNPLRRPNTQNLMDNIHNWYYLKLDQEFNQQVKAIEDSLIKLETSNNLIYKTHPQAIYTSRLLDLKEINSYISENLRFHIDDLAQPVLSMFQKFNTSLEAFYLVFQLAYNMTSKKYDDHILNYPTRLLFKEARVFDSRFINLSAISHNITSYQYILEFSNPSMEFLQEWAIYCNINLAEIEFN